MRSRGLAGPGRFPPAQIAEIKALACELPAESGRPLSRWSHAEIAREAVERGVVCAVSGTTVWRYLSEDAIRPWAWRSWIFPRGPDFAEKAGRVLDLYERCWQGRRLDPGDYVISADEKSQLQALLGRHDPVAPGPGRRGLHEFEYERHGTLAYLAALDVHDPKRGLFGRCEEKTGIEPFGRLVEQVMTTEPYASAQRVFWIVDNGSSHAGKTSVQRLQTALTSTSSPRGSLPSKLPGNSEPDRSIGATPAATSTISSTASTNVITYQPPLDRTYLRERPLAACR